MKKLFALLTAIVVLSCTVLNASAFTMINGEDDGSTVELCDGVYFSNVSLASGSYHGLQKLNVVEFDLANQGLDLAILKGDYIVSKKTLAGYVSAYNQSHDDSEVIAAVNGDLWMTGVHSNNKVTTSVLTVPRGVLISDGIIYCSSQVPGEAKEATNGEGHSTFWAFGITDDYVPMVGQPIVTLGVNNTTKSTKVYTDAFNRLPAIDTLVVYNGDCNYTNYALEDAYEVVLSNISGEFKSGTTVKGTVSAVYSSNDGTSPALNDDSIVLTARGTAVDSIIGYAVGDKIEIDINITDASGRDNDWNSAKLAIGGHIPLVLDGASLNQSGSYGYPSTIVGYKNDGSIFFLQNDGRQSIWSTGLKFSTAGDLMLQMGVNSCINLDGGGSSTMIVGDELVNKPSDGSARAVINGIALVTASNREPQAEFKATLPYRFNARYISFADADGVNHIRSGYSNDTTVSNADGAARLSVTKASIDPYVYLNVSGAVNSISANNYKYVVIKYKTSPNVTTPVTELFLCAGTVSAPTGGKSVTFTQGTAGEWNTQIIDLSSVDFWSGTIHGLRIDYFVGNSSAGEYMDIEYVAFAKTAEDAQAYADGTAVLPTVPAESTSLKPTSASGFTVNGTYLTGVKSGTTAYGIIGGLTGSKIEVFDKNGITVRNSNVCTGYTVASHNTALEECDVFTIVVKGDVNGDGVTNNLDAARVLKYAASLVELDEVQLLAADANGDGVVNTLDAAYILKLDAGLIQE